MQAGLHSPGLACSLNTVTTQPIDFQVTEQFVGERLDVFLAGKLPDLSRVNLRRAITAGSVLVDAKPAKPAYRLKMGQMVCLAEMPVAKAGPEPEEIPLTILYEDEFLAAINKPPGMVVHPAKGHWSGTLASAMAFHFQNLSSSGGPTRPGIVHRLDRDTSGVIVIAKSDEVHLKLAALFESRSVQKEYFAIVSPVPDRDRDRIEKPIGAHPYQREKMAIREGHSTSRSAETFYEVSERFAGFAALKVLPKTGRTHQIRVHLTSIGHPVLCDKLYGGRSQITARQLCPKLDDDSIVLNRQALHARRISFTHPITGKPLEIAAELPDDLTRVLDLLRS